VEGAGLLCMPLGSSVIVLHDRAGRLLPDRQPFASFGPYGGLIFTTTMTSTVQLPLTLEHNIYRTERFRLEPIASERGWTYVWHNRSGEVIDRISVLAPLTYTYGVLPPPNLFIAGADLPTCVSAQDTIYITATHVTTPTLKATTSIMIFTAPDETRCTVVDLGIRQTAGAAAINAGQLVTFTNTITNYADRGVTALVTDTLEPAGALAALNLPAECQRRGHQVACRFEDMAGQATRTFDIGVHTAWSFDGALRSRSEVWPADGADPLIFDNRAGPLEVTVRSPARQKLALPLLLHE